LSGFNVAKHVQIFVKCKRWCFKYTRAHNVDLLYYIATVHTICVDFDLWNSGHADQILLHVVGCTATNIPRGVGGT
jgi:hypothetical protein